MNTDIESNKLSVSVSMQDPEVDQNFVTYYGIDSCDDIYISYVENKSKNRRYKNLREALADTENSFIEYERIWKKGFIKITIGEISLVYYHINKEKLLNSYN